MTSDKTPSKIIVKNFLSWEYLEFNFPEGTTLVDGFNYDDNTPEGSGKSAILNALCWGLFGKIPKDANVDDVIREGQKSCSVEVYFNEDSKDDETYIFRTRKPNELGMHFTWRKGSTTEKGKDAKETQKMIEEYIGMSFETFCQSVYFAQNYPNKFVTATEDQKGKILSEIQDLMIFDRARKKTLAEIKENDLDLMAIKKDLERQRSVEERYESELSNIEQLKSVFNREKQEKIAELRDSSDTIGNQVKQLLKTHAEFTEEECLVERDRINKGIRELIEEKARFKEELRGLESKKLSVKRLEFQVQKLEGQMLKAVNKIKDLKNPKDKACPTCGTVLEKIDKSHFKVAIEEQQHEKQEFAQEREGLLKELEGMEIPTTSELQEGISSIKTMLKREEYALSEVETQLKKISLVEKELISKNDEQDRIFTMIEKEEARDGAHFDKKLKEIKTALTKTQKETKTLRENLKVLTDHGNRLLALKDGFKEVKQYVFQGLLSELTRKSNRFLSELFELPIKIDFSNLSGSGEVSKIKVEVTIDGHKRPLGLYSGGQFRRIQLAVDLALSEIVSARGDSPMNLRIFDEYFKDLSESSMEKALRLIETLQGCTILIEHNSIFKSIVDNTFKVELIDGVSKEAA